jgi:hypothetical protein
MLVAFNQTETFMPNDDDSAMERAARTESIRRVAGEEE